MDANQTNAERNELASQLVEVNRGRANFYRMLAQLYFKELTAEQVKHLAGLDFSAMSGDDETIRCRHMPYGFLHTLIASGRGRWPLGTKRAR